SYWVEEVARGLTFASTIAWLPTGEGLIEEREGGLRLIRHCVLEPNPISGAPASFQNAFNGLKDIVIGPDYRSSHQVYLSITEGTFEQHHAAVFRARYSDGGLVDLKRIFHSSDEVGVVGPASARLLLLADKTLLVANLFIARRRLLRT